MGRVQPVGQPEHGVDEPLERVVGRAVFQYLDIAKTLAELQQHIQGLTFGIPNCRIEELPMQL